MATVSQQVYDKYHTPDFSWTVKSNTTKGRTYKVSYYSQSDTWECDCVSHKLCRHIRQIQNKQKGKVWKKQ